MENVNENINAVKVEYKLYFRVNKDSGETYAETAKKFKELCGQAPESHIKQFIKYIDPISFNYIAIKIVGGDQKGTYTFRYYFQDNNDKLFALIEKCENGKLKPVEVYNDGHSLSELALHDLKQRFNDKHDLEVSKNFEKLCRDAKLDPASDKNEVVVIEYVEGKTKFSHTFSGTLESIFGQYIAQNNKLKDNNNNYLKFADSLVSKVYYAFIDKFSEADKTVFLSKVLDRDIKLD